MILPSPERCPPSQLMNYEYPTFEDAPVSNCRFFRHECREPEIKCKSVYTPTGNSASLIYGRFYGMPTIENKTDEYNVCNTKLTGKCQLHLHLPDRNTYSNIKGDISSKYLCTVDLVGYARSINYSTIRNYTTHHYPYRYNSSFTATLVKPLTITNATSNSGNIYVRGNCSIVYSIPEKYMIEASVGQRYAINREYRKTFTCTFQTVLKKYAPAEQTVATSLVNDTLTRKLPLIAG